MDWGFILLRLLHVGAGILWAGGAVVTTRFVVPTALELGPKGAPFMLGLTQQRKLTQYLQIAGGTTVLAGTILYWINSNGDVIGRLTGGGAGTVFGIGGLAAWAAFGVGVFLTAPPAKRLGELSAEAAAAEGAPSDDLKARLAATQSAIRRWAAVTFYLLLVSIAAMATARYFG